MRVFISYSHRDEKEKDELLTFLSPLVANETLQIWDDRKIHPGEEWEAAIRGALESTDMALLLISANFLASRYCTTVEAPELFRSYQQRGLAIVPIILSSCLWEKLDWIPRLQALPLDCKAIDLWSNRAQVITDVCREIAKLADRLKAPAPAALLLVDDHLSPDDPFHKSLQKHFAGRATVALVANVADACKRLAADRGVIGCVSDLVFPENAIGGVQVAKAAVERKVPVLIFTSHDPRHLGVAKKELARLGLDEGALMKKPHTVKEYREFLRLIGKRFEDA